MIRTVVLLLALFSATWAEDVDTPKACEDFVFEKLPTVKRSWTTDEKKSQSVRDSYKVERAEKAKDCAKELSAHANTLTALLTGEAVKESDLKKLERWKSLAIGPFSNIAGIRRYLIRLHRTYRNVKLTMTKPMPNEIHDSDDRIHRLMALYGLRERLAAALDSGVSVAETGDDEVRSARDTSLETQVRGLVRWESEHFGDDKPKAGMDFSIGGSFGFIPIVTLVSVIDPITKLPVGGEQAPIPFSTYFQGFTWDIVGRGHFPARGRFESGIFLKFGHGALLSDTDSFERKGAAAGSDAVVVMQRFRNGTGRVAPFWETGVEGRLYGEESMDQVHSEKTYLNPAPCICPRGIATIPVSDAGVSRAIRTLIACFSEWLLASTGLLTR